MRLALLIVTILVTRFAIAAPCAIFTGEVDGTTVEEAITSGRCIEIRDAVIRGPVEPVMLRHRIAESVEAYTVTFGGKVSLPDMRRFYCFNCTFEKGIEAFAKIPSLQIMSSDIRGNAFLHSLKSAQVVFDDTTFHGHAIFVSSVIGSLNLPDVNFARAVDFSGAKIGELNAPRLQSDQPIVIAWDQFGLAMLAEDVEWASATRTEEDRRGRLAQVEVRLRFWQRNAAALNQNRDVTAINYEILQLHRRYFMRPYGVEWWATLVVGLPTRYGTRPYRPLWIALICVTAFGLVYLRQDALVKEPDTRTLPMRPRLLFTLAFSLDTFLPFVEVTGARKWGWVIAERFRWIEMAERVTGLMVASLAAYGIAAAFL